MTMGLLTQWGFKQLGELASFRNGVNYNKESFGEGIKVVGVSDFQDYTKPRYEDLDEINPEGIVSERNLLKDGDIVFVRSNGNRELIGRSLYIHQPPEDITHSAFTIRLRFHSSKVVPLFFAYCFRTHLIRKGLTAHGGGTNISNLNQDILGSLEVPLPPVAVQERIANILAAYDKLIENDQKRISILEKIARSFYREWFTDFRFPGHADCKFVSSSRGKIPEGWQMKSLASLIKSHIGGGWGKEESDATHSEPAWVIRGTDIPDARICRVEKVPRRFHTASNLRSRKAKAGDIFFEVSGGSKGQPVGRTLFVTEQLLSSLDSNPVMCASFCKLIEPDTDVYTSEMLYLSFLEGYESGEIEQYQVQSTGISNFKWTEYIANIERAVPPKALRVQFGKLVAPMLSQIATLGLRSANLLKTRDYLITRLLSGQIKLEAN
jgi:type I restriction enzyme S subunit